MVDFLIAIVLLIIIGVAIVYIVKAKKSGARCVGCPDSGSCGHGKREAGSCGRNCSLPYRGVQKPNNRGHL